MLADKPTAGAPGGMRPPRTTTRRSQDTRVAILGGTWVVAPRGAAAARSAARKRAACLLLCRPHASRQTSPRSCCAERSPSRSSPAASRPLWIQTRPASARTRALLSDRPPQAPLPGEAGAHLAPHQRWLEGLLTLGLLRLGREDQARASRARPGREPNCPRRKGNGWRVWSCFRSTPHAPPTASVTRNWRCSTPRDRSGPIETPAATPSRSRGPRRCCPPSIPLSPLEVTGGYARRIFNISCTVKRSGARELIEQWPCVRALPPNSGASPARGPTARVNPSSVSMSASCNVGSSAARPCTEFAAITY